MSELTIRPTAKFIKAGAVLACIVFLALEVVCIKWGNAATGVWVMLVPLLVLVWPALRALRRQYTKTTLTADRLRYESGLASKSTRTIQLAKLQDVRVDQKLMQRLFQVGDLAIETAGEASRLTMRNVDDPRLIADQIVDAAHGNGDKSLKGKK